VEVSRDDKKVEVDFMDNTETIKVLEKIYNENLSLTLFCGGRIAVFNKTPGGPKRKLQFLLADKNYSH
jgi:tRNA(Phe) wybutosine-synthesizing methylase Tyw3